MMGGVILFVIMSLNAAADDISFYLISRSSAAGALMTGTRSNITHKYGTHSFIIRLHYNWEHYKIDATWTYTIASTLTWHTAVMCSNNYFVEYPFFSQYTLIGQSFHLFLAPTEMCSFLWDILWNAKQCLGCRDHTKIIFFLGFSILHFPKQRWNYTGWRYNPELYILILK